MPNADMHQNYMRSLMFMIAGVPRAGERDAWLYRLSKKTDVGYRSLLAAYSGQWISRNKYCSDRTLQILELMAENAKRSNDLVEYAELQLSIWKTSPEHFQDKIDMVRTFIDDMRRYDAERSRSAIPARDNADAGIAATSTGFSAATAKA